MVWDTRLVIRSVRSVGAIAGSQAVGALRHRYFRLYWVSGMGLSAAMGMQFLILRWLALELTDSAAQLGVVIALYGVPNLALLAFGGIFADRFDWRWPLFFTGVGFTGFFSMGTTVLQLTTPGQLRGRMMSLWLIGAAMHYIGALPLGAVGEYWGWPVSLGGAALVMVAFVLWLGVLRPTLRGLRV